MKANLKFLTVLLCTGFVLGGCCDDPIAPENPDTVDDNPPVEQPDNPKEEPLTDGSLFTIQLNDGIMAIVGTSPWRAIAYGNGKYVAVGDRGIAYSTNGSDWTFKQIGSLWNDIVYHPEYKIFVAVGPIGYNGYSYDGVNWTLVTIKYNYMAIGIEPSHNNFIAVRSVGSYYGISQRGTTWNELAYDCSGSDIAVGNSELISVDYEKINIFKYPSWEKSIEVEKNYLSIVYNLDKNEYLAVGQMGYVAKSTDNGNTWTETNTNASGAIHSVDYSSVAGVYIACCGGSANNEIITSEDGMNWDVKKTVSNGLNVVLIMQ